MKKITFKIMFKATLLLLLTSSVQMLMAQDIILIEKGLDGEGKPVLYNAIMGDTTATGERAHPNATYRLTRGEIYPVVNGLYMDFDITIDALPDDPGDPVRPPMLVPFADDLGELPYALLWSIADKTMTLKHLMFNGVQNPVEKTLGANAIVTKMGRTVIDNCVFTQFTGSPVNAGGGNGYKVYITNCVFRNIQHPTAWWEADPFMAWATNGDTLIMNNNTYFNVNGHTSNSNWENAYTNYFEFDHNTVYGGNFNVLASFAITNAVFTNNLIIDAYAMGIDTSGLNAGWCDSDGLTPAIMPIDTNDAVKMMDDLGLVEADRRAEVHNNAYFWSTEVKTHWDSRGAQFPDVVATFMNSRDIAMYADDATWPLLNESNNIEEDPILVDTDTHTEVMEGYATYGNGVFDSFLPGGPAFEGYLHFYPASGANADGLIFFVEWPLAEDLSYTSSVLLKHSTTGGPVGDPRWYGDPDGIGENDFLAKSNLKSYPNPFSTTTTISYDLDNMSNVKLSVYNVLGKEVAVLVNEDQGAGNHVIQWNADNSSAGVYFISLKVNNHSATSKIILNK